MRRREFIKLIAGVMAARPLSARAQQPVGTRRIALLVGIAADDPNAQASYAILLQRLQQLGWTEGRNVHIDGRWAAGSAAEVRKYAAELVALAPDVILAIGSPSLEAILAATRTVPVVFTIVIDPVGSGFVDSLARPGGNASGFTSFEYNLSGKWLELLKQIAPRVTRAAIVRNPAIPAGIGQFAVIQSVAPTVGVDVTPINERDASEVGRAIMEFARSADGGLIVTAGPWPIVHRDLIVDLCARYRLPAVYPERLFAVAGGLISYGANYADEYRRAADYVDRVLRGEKPRDMPVQAPTKYELVINLKTTKTLGLDMPATVLARADEVIE